MGVDQNIMDVDEAMVEGRALTALIDLLTHEEEDLPSDLFKLDLLEGKVLETEIDASPKRIGNDEEYQGIDDDGEHVRGCFEAAVLAYIQSLPYDPLGYGVLKEIQFFSCCIGFYLFVLSSICIEERNDKEGYEERYCTGAAAKTRTFLKCILKREKFNDRNDRCFFSLNLETNASSDADLGRVYIADFSMARHNHLPLE